MFYLSKIRIKPIDHSLDDELKTIVVKKMKWKYPEHLS